MKILTAEISLREETRGLEQAKSQMQTDKFESSADELSITQEELANRTETVIDKIHELPDGESVFAKEIAQLTNAMNAMGDAEEILAGFDMGAPAIAAETEAIEWLLQAKRIGSGGGGGGGSPGAGSRTGQNLAGSALALLGNSKEKKANIVERETNQATGKSGRELPEEFRIGLDQYFEKLEGGQPQE
jgi:hypothetical protein